jgi:signal transduction histidine kinase
VPEERSTVDTTRRLHASIFTRLLIALLLVSLLPLAAFWRLERQRMVQSGDLEAKEQLQLFAERTVQRIDDWTQLNLSVLEMATDEPSMRSMDSRAQRTVLKELPSQLPWAYLFHTIDLQGMNVARTDRAPLTWYGDREYFKQILAGRPYAVEIQIGRTSHRPALLLAVPISAADHTLKGMLVEAATLDHVTEAVTAARLGLTGHVLLMTRTGRLIADPGLPLKRQLRDFSQHPSFLAAQQGDGFYRYTFHGVARVAQVLHTNFGWIAVAQQAAVENLATVDQVNGYALLLLAVTAALMVGISAVVARLFASRIDRATRALAAAKAEAEAANRSKTSFVAAAVHDLMQPLNAARMFAGAARAQATSEAEKELLDGVDRALEAEDEVLSSLLDISRLESGMFETNERPFVISGLIATLGREFGILARARGIELRVVQSSAVVRSDEMLLRRILQNYLANALRYSQRGKVLLGCRRVGEALRIEVWDTGPGIPEEHQRRIFLEFQRLDNGAAITDRGAGLGLAIVERIGKRLGHRIGLRSWVGRGSVFSVQVPRAARESLPVREGGTELATPARPRSVGERDEHSPLAGRRVCTVEDEPQAREALRALLTGWGCEVMAAGSGAEIMRLAESSAAPEILLLDYQLPDGVGPQFVPELMGRWGATFQVVVISGERDEAARQRVLEQGWSFLAKPVSPSKLRALLTHLVLRGATRADFARS